MGDAVIENILGQLNEIKETQAKDREETNKRFTPIEADRRRRQWWRDRWNRFLHWILR